MAMNLATLKKAVLKKVKPSAEEVAAERRMAHALMEEIRGLEGSHVEVMLCGSLARETHLKGDRDLDLFVLFPESVPRERFVEEGLRIGKTIFRGHPWEEAYSEHPYIRGEIRGFEVEVVPGYKVKSAEKIQSAVDRSPFHQRYLEKRLTGRLRDEVRLVRQFLKGIKCYGAELRYASVPGYVTELLVLKYGSFEATVKAMAAWRKGEVIDLENHRPAEDARKKFDAPFIVVDPVDRERNVAAALSLNQFTRMIAAARAFTQKPRLSFFFGKKEKTWPLAKVKAMLHKTELAGVETGYPKAVSDVVWGKLRRFGKKLANELGELDFKVLRHDEWTDEKKRMCCLYELEAATLQKAMTRTGPPVTDQANSAAFLAKHQKPLSGPRIEEGRWVVEVERKHTQAKTALKELLQKTKASEREGLRQARAKKTRVLDEKALVEWYTKDKEFAEFLTEFLKGEEDFLDY